MAGGGGGNDDNDDSIKKKFMETPKVGEEENDGDGRI